MKHPKDSTTNQINALFAALSGALAVIEANYGILQQTLDPQDYLIGMGLLAFINILLRFKTNEPISFSSKKYLD